MNTLVTNITVAAMFTNITVAAMFTNITIAVWLLLLPWLQRLWGLLALMR
jgi:hypothetical protein